MNGTIKPSLRDDDHFGLGNIPLGIASRKDGTIGPRPVTRLRGDVFFLPELISCGLIPELSAEIAEALHQSSLNQLATLGRPAHRKLRVALQSLLSSRDEEITRKLAICRASTADVDMHVPVHIGDFSDFSCSLHHVLNAGEAVVGVRSEPPGFRHFPIGYAGRSSTIVPSGTTLRRPLGQFRSADGVAFGPSKSVDFELEVACVIGRPSEMGSRVSVAEAEEHVFGFVLLNDWSARDIQGLEMNPLGPFNGKSFGTSISPWIITADALEPFKLPVSRGGSPGAVQGGAAYLTKDGDKAHYAMTLQAELITSSSKSGSGAASAATVTTLCTSRLESLYWTFRDMIAHHTINGCALRAGDLLATGTVSGEMDGSHGCLLEITRGGKQALTLEKNGGERRYLEDDDVVRLTGWAGELGSDGCVGFGSCVGVIAPALPWKER